MELPVTENDQNPPMPSSASMQDVPLSNDQAEPEDKQTTAGGSMDKIPSKTNSLKRFFKKSLNKRSSSYSYDDTEESRDAATDADTEEANEEVPVKVENIGGQTENSQLEKSPAGLRRSRSRFFSLRNRNTNNAADVAMDEPSSSNSVPSPSKHSLRASISNYFSSVFKRRQSSAAKNASNIPMDQSDFGDNDDSELSRELKRELEQNRADDEDESMDIESQTAEIIDELETMTVTEQGPKGAAAAFRSAVI